MKNSHFIFLCLIFFGACHSHAQSVESFLQDLKKGPASTSLLFTQLPNSSYASKAFKTSKVVQEFRMYKYNNHELPQNYMSSFIQKSRRELFHKQAQWIKLGRCDLEASGEILNGKKFVKQESFSAYEIDIIDAFESSLIKIEATGCVNADSALKVFNEYIKADFQKQAVAELKSSEMVADTICEKTEVFGIGKSHYCYDVSVNYDEAGNILTLHTYNVGNAPKSIADAPVYFREIVATFKKMNNAQVGVSFFVFVRGADVPMLARSIARSKIKETQLKLFKLLNERVR